jgi:Ni/Fe-hydrogenase subunit HybB-like protein
VPDLAILRERFTGLRGRIYRILSLGWTGSSSHWSHHGWLYLLIAALATPLVISVHSVVSWDFALSIVPGWHTTIFAPYFVAGAIHSGLAMVLILLIPMRTIYRLEAFLNMQVFENVAKTILFTTLIMLYSYLVEMFVAWYSAHDFERDIHYWRAVGPYTVAFWIMFLFNAVVPLVLFFKKVRTSIPALIVVSILINIGMWFERYVIILSSPAHEFDPYSWGLYQGPTFIEYCIMIGSFSLFFFLFLLFTKLVPTISMTEVKEDLPEPRRNR